MVTISLLISDVVSCCSDYRGNFDMYVKLRDEKTKNAARVYEAYQAKRAHMMEFIDKFRGTVLLDVLTCTINRCPTALSSLPLVFFLSLANAKRATMVQSRIKAVEKMDAEAPEPVEMDQTWRFNIPCSGPLGRPIISIDDVSFDYTPIKPDGTKKPESEFLLQKVNFGVDLDSRIAILGANGQGSSSLLELLESLGKDPARDSRCSSFFFFCSLFISHQEKQRY